MVNFHHISLGLHFRTTQAIAILEILQPEIMPNVASSYTKDNSI